ncbi:MAG: alkaline phosphatase family protein [bacterium]
MNRTQYRILPLIILLAAVLLPWNAHAARKTNRKVVILGFDGMDPQLTKKWIDEGRLPHFKTLADRGDFRPLRTSIPPQSPVAWSNFVTGLNPGGHNIYDFIARDPNTYLPYLSTSEVKEPKRKLKLFGWVTPISKVEVIGYRKGTPFWEVLDDHDVPATILRVPSNFPPATGGGRSLSGMGTPDVLGTYGTFLFYSTAVGREGEQTSGRIYPVEVKENVITTKIVGPTNPFKEERPKTEIPFTVHVDPKNPVAKIVIQDKEIILSEGGWSDWVRIEFKMMAFTTTSAICRFYLKSVRPEFQLYVTPLNIDPYNPSLPISHPEKYAQEIAEKIGLFYTQGMPEDTWALNGGVLNEDEFLAQSEIPLKERIGMLEMELDRFTHGALFCYFSITDSIQHMFMEHIDPQHPAFDKEKAEKYAHVIPTTYQKMDEVLGMVMERTDEDTLIMVLSDHGFVPFRRYFNLNTWLHQEGYLGFIREYKGRGGEFFENIDWKKTKAYGLGLNGLYINLKGREGMGIVNPGDKDSLLEELIRKLEAYRDPENGEQVISHVYNPATVYSGAWVKNSPDLIVGYNRNYRASWWTAQGATPREIIGDNTTEWTGDHCIDRDVVPGILFTSRPIKKDNPALVDCAPTILKEFGIEPLPDMVGKPLF